MDIEKLSPAPWQQEEVADGVSDVGRECLDKKGHPDWLVIASDMWRADADFIVLARAAFDVITRRDWTFTKWGSPSDSAGKWGVTTLKGDWPHELLSYEGNAHGDPFAALVEADKWLKEREAKAT